MTDDEYINPWFRVAACTLRRRFEDAGERWSLREAIDFGTIMANLGRNLADAGFGEQCKRDGHDDGYRKGFAKGEQVGRDDALTEVMHCL